MLQKSEIKRDEFLVHMKNWADGLRHCHIDVMDVNGNPMIDVVRAELKQFNSRTGDLTCGEAMLVLHLGWADRFIYLDHTDTEDPQMAECIEDGYLAWMRVYSGTTLLVSLRLYNE